LDGVVFNYLIGNNDAHAKNFSLIYPAVGEVRLAPLYDVVCTVYYKELSPKMAMKIGGEYLADKLTPQHFEKLAEEAGLAKPLVKQRVAELATSVLEGIKIIDARTSVVADVVGIIRQRSEDAITRFAK
jgi:serine/threonine-protein kinase HipA